MSDGSDLPELVEGRRLIDDRPVDLTRFADRAALVAAMGGKLEEHLCCPDCFDQRAIKTGDKAHCDVCGWKGQSVQLLDTVQTGATRLS